MHINYILYGIFLSTCYIIVHWGIIIMKIRRMYRITNYTEYVKLCV